MKILTVIPAIDSNLTTDCLRSISRPDSAAEINFEDILVIDNSRHGMSDLISPFTGIRYYRDPDGHNLGVARSWNIAARQVVEKELDYLVIMSQSMLFGPIKETSWNRELAKHDTADIIESIGHSWHLIAIHRRLFETIGYFDENFYPAYFEQTDWCYRLKVMNLESGWPKVWVNALSQTVARHANLTDAKPLLEYYRKKWGGDKGFETFSSPYGNQPIGYFEHHSIPELAKKYKLRRWW